MPRGILQVLLYEHQVKVVTVYGNMKIFQLSELDTILDMLHLTKSEYEVVNYVQKEL